MDGYQYEKRCAKFLQENGFSDITVTPGSGDQGIDITARKGGKKYGIQCKYYEGTVGNKAVQEVYAGAAYYGCDIAMVITNSTFSKSATELALRLNVILQENIDAISLYHSSEQISDEEKEALEFERIERLLQEKYRLLRMKFPETKSNDDEVTSYIESIESKIKSYEDSDQKWFQLHFERVYRASSLFLSDSELKRKEKAWERAGTERVKHESQRNKELLNQVNYDIGKFVSAGVSETSAKKLIALFQKVYSYAGSPDTVKYYRMMDKWKTLEQSLPSVAEQKDKAAEELAIKPVRKKLENVEREIKQISAILNDSREYKRKLTTLSNLQQKLQKLRHEKTHMNCEDELEALKAQCQTAQEQYKRDILELDTKIAAKSNQIKQTQAELNQMSIFSYKKKNERKNAILSLEKEKDFLELQRKDLATAGEKDAQSYQSLVEDVKMKFDSKRSALEKEIKILEKKIDRHKKNLGEENPEKNRERLRELEKLLPLLRQEVKNARKNYLLETYREI